MEKSSNSYLGSSWPDVQTETLWRPQLNEDPCFLFPIAATASLSLGGSYQRGTPKEVTGKLQVGPTRPVKEKC